MPLRSQAFKGDPKFEACLVSDAAHVTPGTEGCHVSKIHFALMVLDGYFPTMVEVYRCQYGPSTAKGVLAFKRKRAVINHSYQSQADNIVGKMTIAIMDAELYARERMQHVRSLAQS